MIRLETFCWTKENGDRVLVTGTGVDEPAFRQTLVTGHVLVGVVDPFGDPWSVVETQLEPLGMLTIEERQALK